MGSAGETRAWYVTVGQTMPPADVEHRLANLLSLTRLLLTMIRHERDKPSDWMERNREHCLTCVPATAIVVSSLRSHLSIGASIISHRRVEPPASLVKTKRDRHPEAPVSLRSSRKSKTRA